MKSTNETTVFQGRNPAEIVLWAGVTGALLMALVSISLAQLCLVAAILSWVFLLIAKGRRAEVPGFFWPLLGYIAWSLLASALSRDPATSFSDSRELLLALIVPVALAAFYSIRAYDLGTLALPVSALLAGLYALARYALAHAASVRVRGFMGHYMTQAGLLMLFAAAALALILYRRDKSRWLWGAALAVSLPALALTLTRSAWIGLAAAVCLVLLLYKPRTLIVVPVLALAFFVLATPAMKQRARSIFTTYGYSNQERLEYVRAGLKIIAQNPVHGTGPRTVSKVFQYPEYGLSEQAKRNVHLHNDMIQIAAERGLPALLAWLAFLVWAVVDLLKLARAGDDRALRAAAVGGLAAIAALFVGGLFEYNFGDSEVASLFYFLIALPFARRAAGRGTGASAAGEAR
jgi:O-antigen ligase